MPFLIIRGTFHVVGYSPDGDSIRFRANQSGNWEKLDIISQELTGFLVNLNARDHAQLRFEAIDALETHYDNEHQPLEFAAAAQARIFELLGIQNVVFSPSGNVVSANDGVPGYILSRSIDRYHRPISFVFAGNPPGNDGTEVRLTSTMLKQSVNYKLLAEGLVYPTYYTGLFSDLRKTMTSAAKKARTTNKGFWPQDHTNSGATVDDLISITTNEVILPKLFRRLVTFLENGGDLSGFILFLKKDRERIMVLPDGHFTHFDTVVKVTGNVVKITELPENIIFLE